MKIYGISLYDHRYGPGTRTVVKISGSERGQEFTMKMRDVIKSSLMDPAVDGITITGYGDPFDEENLTITNILASVAVIAGKDVRIHTNHRFEDLLKMKSKNEFDTSPRTILGLTNVIVDPISDYENNDYPKTGNISEPIGFRFINVQESLKKGEVVYTIEYALSMKEFGKFIEL